MEKIENFLNKYFYLAILVLSIPAVWALFVPGFYGASDDIHIAWLYQMHETLLAGKIPPRFVPDLSFGFGYPLFNFVFPLPFYIAEIIHLLGFSFVDSIKLLFFLTIPFSGIFMFLMLRQFSVNFASLSGAILYMYTPYRSVDMYIRGAIGEILVFVFLPLIFYSITKLIKDKSFKWVGLCGLSLGALILTHNISAYMFFPFASLYAILMIIFVSNERKRAFLKLALSALLALTFSSYFWLPAILESSLMKYDTVFNFVDHFPTIRQLFTPYWGYGASVAGPYDGMSFFLGTANIFVLVFGMVSFFKFYRKFKTDDKVIIIWAGISLMAVFFLMNFRSSFLWERIPLLPYFQFPWRFLIITTFTIPILIICFKYLKLNKLLLFLIIILTITTSASYFRPQDFLGRKDEYFINRYIPIPVASGEYLKTQEEYLRLPKNTKVRPDKNYPLVSVEGGEIKELVKFDKFDAQLTVNSKSGGVLTYNKYLFPGWSAKIDDVEVPLSFGEPFGQISIEIPEGYHKIEINFSETKFKSILDIISLAGFISIIVIMFSNLFKKIRIVKNKI